jgi:hypothetical protein
MDVTQKPDHLRPSRERPARLRLQACSGAARAAVIAAGTAAACTACCVAVVLPAVIMANIGSMLVLLDRAHGWVIWLAVFAVAARGFGSVTRLQAAGRSRGPAPRYRRHADRRRASCASWSLIKPLTFHAFGITKKQVDKN